MGKSNYNRINSIKKKAKEGNIISNKGIPGIVSKLADELPPVADGELATVQDIKLETKQTKPPQRYTEGTLIVDMEGAGKYVKDPELRKILKNKDVPGLGTPATRSGILEELKNAKFLVSSGKAIVSSDAAKALIKALPDTLQDIERTALWEAKLEAIAAGEGTLEAFLKEVVGEIDSLIKSMPSLYVDNEQGSAKGAGAKVTNKSAKASSPSKSANPSRPATPAMINFAKTLSKKAGLNLPKDVESSFDSCKLFIDKAKAIVDNKANKTSSVRSNAKESTPSSSQPTPAIKPPTDKQIAFAKSLATKAKTSVPAEALTSGIKCSEFINKMLGK